MDTSTTISNWATSLQNGSFETVSAAVLALTSDNNQLDRLEHIARHRLDRLASLPPGQRLRSQEDPLGFVHDTIALVLGRKRKARPRHLRSPHAFFNFVQGVMQSCISNALKAVVAKGEHLSIGPEDESGSSLAEPESRTDVVREVEMRETERELVARLRQSFVGDPTMLQQVDLLEREGLPENRLPHGDLTAKQRHRFRARTGMVLRAMAAREGVLLPSGMELFQP